MIIFKANIEIKTVFHKLIKTMGQDVKWTEIFVINNNDIILAGEVRSLFFNLDHRKAYSNVVELPINEEAVESVKKNPVLANALNMLIYAFGKWGAIKGLKVEMNYDQLNKLLNSVVEEIGFETMLTRDKFRFYKAGVQITYEEVIQAILDMAKAEDKNNNEIESDEKDSEEDELDEIKEDDANEYELGLWHNMSWTLGHFSFEKEELSENDRRKARLGNDFYMVNYKCPVCKEKIYMVVYPMGKEFRIETDVAPVYLSRAYTCSTCNSMYTPVPYKLLNEGDVFHIEFEDDKEAYEDYLELLGKEGARTSNYNFNKFEADYNKKDENTNQGLEEIDSDLEDMSESEILELREKMDSGFFPDQSVEKYAKKIDKILKNRTSKNSKEIEDESIPTAQIDLNQIEKNQINTKTSQQLDTIKEEIYKESQDDSGDKGDSDFTPKIKTKSGHAKEVKDIEENKERLQTEGIQNDKIKVKQENQLTEHEFLKKEILVPILEGKNEFFDEAVEKLSSKQMESLKNIIQLEDGINESQRKDFIEKIEKKLTIINSINSNKTATNNSIENAIEYPIDREKKIIQMVDSCQRKNYEEISLLINEVKREDCSEEVKESALKSMSDLLIKRGIAELQNIIGNIPENITRSQYKEYREKIEQYKDIDKSSYQRKLDEKRDLIEKREITILVKRANTADRKSLSDLYNQLKTQDFEERNVSPFLEKVYDKMVTMDKAVINKICPDPADVTFEEGLKKYEEISSGMFLPELKENVLGMIDKRLTKIKMDECEQLVKKLRKDLQKIIDADSRIYFYDIRKMIKGDTDDAESRIINNALNTYANSRQKYEYPILICDSSLFGNGVAGFVLTPDRIYFNGLISSEVINIKDIEYVFSETGVIGKGVYVNLKNVETIKISGSLKLNRLVSFGKILNDFVSYLKEKPESRNISYLAKEKHKDKCCYRCGYTFRTGDICPKCGSKFNG